jgi:hypothetical protein
MSQLTRWLIVLATAATIAGLSASPALAIYPHLNTTLSGPAINGVVPTGTATVDQSKLPTNPLTLDVQVSSVNLPDGTILSVVLTDCGTAPVGTIKLNHEQGQLKTKVPGCQVGRQSAIYVNNGSTTILSGGAPWQVG